MQIRDLTPADFSAVIELWEQAGLTRPWNPPEVDLQRALDGATSTVLGAFTEQQLVGTIMVGHDGHRGWIYYLAVAESHRGSGLGRQLMTAGETWLHKRGAVKVQLMIRSSNSDVLSFYDHLGYQDDDVRVRSKRLSQ